MLSKRGERLRAPGVCTACVAGGRAHTERAPKERWGARSRLASRVLERLLFTEATEALISAVSVSTSLRS